LASPFVKGLAYVAAFFALALGTAKAAQWLDVTGSFKAVAEGAAGVSRQLEKGGDPTEMPEGIKQVFATQPVDVTIYLLGLIAVFATFALLLFLVLGSTVFIVSAVRQRGKITELALKMDNRDYTIEEIGKSALRVQEESLKRWQDEIKEIAEQVRRMQEGINQANVVREIKEVATSKE